MANWAAYVFLILMSYLVGSIPFGLLVGRILFNSDIREFGSGNIGATNIYRNWGALPALLVFILDFFKGAFGVLIVKISFTGTFENVTLFSLLLVSVAIASIVGSTYSIYIGFKGGKGVGCAAGALLIIWPYITLILFFVFITAVGISKYVSLGSMIIAILFPVLIIINYPKNVPFMAFSLIASLLVIYKHRENIRRIYQGTERKLW